MVKRLAQGSLSKCNLADAWTDDLLNASPVLQPLGYFFPYILDHSWELTGYLFENNNWQVVIDVPLIYYKPSVWFISNFTVHAVLF